MSRPQTEHSGYREVIYIGPPPPRPSNPLGVIGFLTTFLSCGLLSPLGLLMSLIALGRAPRGFALVGTILSGVGTGLMVAGGMSGYEEASRHENRHNAQVTRTQLYQAQGIIQNESQSLEALPNGVEGNKAILHLTDAWGNSLRYDLYDEGYVLRSAGRDGRYESHDDLTIRGDFEVHAEYVERY